MIWEVDKNLVKVKQDYNSSITYIHNMDEWKRQPTNKK